MPAVLPRATESICPACGKRVPAELFARDGDVWIRQDCPTDGSREGLYFRDVTLFDQLDQVVGDYVHCRDAICLDGAQCDLCLDKTYNIMIEVTNNCNLSCPVCCSDANNPYSPDPTIDQILQRLPPVRSGLFGRLRRPNIVLFGGEPTVHKDLPRLIRELVARGYVPRVATNGVRMTDEAYLRELRAAGLKWVILQFDGFDDDVSEALRGERLLDKKLLAIEMMQCHGFKVQIGTMMVRGLNSHYAGELIEFVGRNPGLFWLSFYPNAAQNRFDGFPTRETFTADMLDEIERTTGGRLARADFVATMRWAGRLYRVFRTPNLRQKQSTLSMVLVFEEDGSYFPLVRLLQPRVALRKWRVWLKLLAALPKVLRYQEDYTPPFLKFMVVEKFHNNDTLDLYEASNCHMAFMTSRSYMPFDMYNIEGKKLGAWPSAVPETAKRRRLIMPRPKIRAAAG